MSDWQRIMLIGADTPRARAYASSIERLGLGPIEGLFYGQQNGKSPPLAKEGGSLDALRLPVISEPVSEIFSRNSWHLQWMNADTINAACCVEALANLKPALAIFAGRGGEVVSETVLSLGIPILHMHPGALPEQRGSTTIYYSILERRPCAVTAFLLEAEIDAGLPLAISSYPPPPASVDLDILFDCAIRSDTMIQVLDHYRRYNRLPQVDPACAMGSSSLYFVVHPVLKHLALLSLDGDQ